jgi:hypothetical protein
MFNELTSTLVWKCVEEGRQGSTRSFQSKETILGLEGSMLEVSGMPPCSEGSELEMLKTCSIATSVLKRRVGSVEDL